jgi:multiple sugar transport system permease protein
MAQAPTTALQTQPVGRTHKHLSPRARETIAALVFASPWLIHLLFLEAIPILASFYFSFCDYQVVKPAQFWGLLNYQRLFTEDPRFVKSLLNTLYMVVVGVPVGMVAGLLIALLMNTHVRGRAIFRTMYYMPSQVSGVALAFMWSWLLNPQFGVVSVMLRGVGIKPPLWLASPTWVKPSFIMMGLWGVGGSMIIWLAGLQAIPETFYEAAEIDGANRWRRFLGITLPLLSPTIFFVLTTSIIGTFQIFTQAYVLTAGGPADASLFYALYLYQQAFTYFRMGYASAMAWVLFIIIMVVTLAQIKLGQRWVYYEAVR